MKEQANVTVVCPECGYGRVKAEAKYINGQQRILTICLHACCGCVFDLETQEIIKHGEMAESEKPHGNLY